MYQEPGTWDLGFEWVFSAIFQIVQYNAYLSAVGLDLSHRMEGSPHIVCVVSGYSRARSMNDQPCICH